MKEERIVQITEENLLSKMENSIVDLFHLFERKNKPTYIVNFFVYIEPFVSMQKKNFLRKGNVSS